MSLSITSDARKCADSFLASVLIGFSSSSTNLTAQWFSATQANCISWMKQIMPTIIRRATEVHVRHREDAVWPDNVGRSRCCTIGHGCESEIKLRRTQAKVEGIEA